MSIKTKDVRVSHARKSGPVTALPKLEKVNVASSDTFKTFPTIFYMSEIMSMIKNSIVRLIPNFQRDPIASKKWKQNLISAIFKGWDLPKLYLRAEDVSRYEHEVVELENQNSMLNFTYDVIDGLQRLTAIDNFLCGKFKTDKDLTVKYNDVEYKLGGKTWEEIVKMSEFYKIPFDSMFSDYAFNITLVQGTDEEISDYFLRLNDGNPMNAQQKRNAMIGRMRDYVRLKTGLRESDSTKLKLFLIKLNAEEDSRIGSPVKGLYLNANNSKMEFDELFLKMCVYMNSDGNPKQSFGSKELDKLYTTYKNVEFPKSKRSKVEKHCKTIQKMFESTNGQYTKATIKNTFMLFMLLDRLERINPDYKIINHSTFFKNFIIIDAELVELSKDTTGGSSCIYQARKGRATSISEFNEALDLVIDKLNSAGDFLDVDDNVILGEYPKIGLSFRDPKRVISNEDKSVLYIKQDGRCAVSGEEFPINLLHKGHVKSWKGGGSSTIGNTVLIYKDINTHLSSQDLEGLDFEWLD